jgi:hypothetical protein
MEKSPPPQQQQQATVKTLAGATFVLSLDVHVATVGDVKTMLADRHGSRYPVARQRLIFCGAALDDALTLSQYTCTGS